MGFCKNLSFLDIQQGQNGQLLHPKLWLQGSSPLATGLCIMYISYVYLYMYILILYTHFNFLDIFTQVCFGINRNIYSFYFYVLAFHTFYIYFVKQVWMTLNNEDTGNSLQIVPETYGMDVPSACTIVIIAGKIEIS